MRHTQLIALVLAIVAGFPQATEAAEIEIPPRPAAPHISLQQGPVNCSRWTDQCVNCARAADGEPPVCSNIGIACQPRAIRCLSPAAPAKK